MSRTNSRESGQELGLGAAPSSKGRILVIDDEEVLAAMLLEFLQGEGFEVCSAGDGRTALVLAESFEPEIVLCDVQLPGIDGLTLLDRILALRPDTLVLMITAYATVENAVAAFHRGAQDYLMKPVIFEELLAKVDRLMDLRLLMRENQALRRQINAPYRDETLIGDSPPMKAVKSLIAKIGPTRSNVLITGESGTGKELVAHALHAQGSEPDSPFLAINCAAIPHDLLENQLFGHVRGAFTGADRDQAGLFAAAGRGTVFLDEIGELPLLTQAKLLRAIENKEVLPVGAIRAQSIAARIVAATNKDLDAEVAAGLFRADLYYRLNVVSIALPPLRDRREDIPALVAALLAKHSIQLGRGTNGVDNAAMRCLMAATWKGNVRELDNVLERAVILGDGPVLGTGDLPPGLGDDGARGADSDPVDSEDLRAAMRAYEREHIRRVLGRHPDDKREAARRLGLGLSSLYRKLEELGLREP